MSEKTKTGQTHDATPSAPKIKLTVTPGKPEALKQADQENPADEQLDQKVEADAGATKEKAASKGAGKTGKTAKGKETKAPSEKFVKLAEVYAKQYPKCKAFHITSDAQVFLEDKRSLAVMHQNSIDSKEKVTTINID